MKYIEEQNMRFRKVFQGFARFFKVLEILDHGVFGKAKKKS